MEQAFNYCIMGFLGVVILVQWFTNKWALEERDWLRNKCVSMYPKGQQIQAASRLVDEYRNRRRV